MNSFNKISEPGTMCHNSESVLVSESQTNKSSVFKHSQLINTSESILSNQAIDPALPPGAVNARFVRNLMTPSGLKPVILFSDTDLDLNSNLDYLPNLPMPECGHVWSSMYNSTPTSGNPVISDFPKFSDRTNYYMAPYANFHSHVIVRLICKPSLMQAQNLWVSRSFNQLDFSNNRNLNEVGFNWNPSKANEIFVLMPWSYEQYVAPVGTSFAEIFGYINVNFVSTLVYTDGNEIPLDINYYFAPYNLNQQVPKPIHNNLSVGTIQIIPASTNVTSNMNIGTLSVNSPTSVSLNAISVITPTNATTYQIKIGATNYTLYYDSAGSYYSATTVILSPGTYAITNSTTAFTSSTIVSNLSYTTTGAPPTYLPTLRRPRRSFNTEEIDDRTDELIWENIPHNFKIGRYHVNVMSTIANSFMDAGFPLTYKVKVISQDPSVVEVQAFSNGGRVFRSYAKNQIEAKIKMCQQIFDAYEVPFDKAYLCEEEPMEICEEEIFEYSYSPTSTCAANTYGVIPSNSPREDHQHVFLAQISLTAANKFTPFNFTINLDTLAANYPYINTREYQRHYIKSHYPIIIFRSNKNPLSNVLLRLVQGTHTDYDSVMQLPGKEWDPTATDMEIQPYWDNVNPGQTSLIIPMTLVVLSGQIDDSGMSILYYFNTSPINYHHKKDYDVTTPTASRNYKTQKQFVRGASRVAVANMLGMCQKCMSAPCVCDRVKDQPDVPSLPVAAPIEMPETVPNLPATLDDLNKKFPNFAPNVKQWIMHRIEENSMKLPNLTALYELAQFEPLQPKYMGLDLSTIIDRLNYYYNNNPTRKVELRALPNNVLFMRKRRDVLNIEQMDDSGLTPLESQDLTNNITTASPSNIDGTTMMTIPVPAEAEAHKVIREKEYNFVGAITAPLLDASGGLLKAIVIPVSHHAFGKEEVTSAKKYRLWKGLPRFKVTTACSSLISGIAYLSNIPSSIELSDVTADNMVYMFSRAQKVLWNDSAEIEFTWMQTAPFQRVDYTVSPAPSAQLGYLVLAFPTISPTDNAGLDTTIKFTLHCDTSNITYLRPSYGYPTWDYPGLQYSLEYDAPIPPN